MGQAGAPTPLVPGATALAAPLLATPLVHLHLFDTIFYLIHMSVQLLSFSCVRIMLYPRLIFISIDTSCQTHYRSTQSHHNFDVLSFIYGSAPSTDRYPQHCSAADITGFVQTTIIHGTVKAEQSSAILEIHFYDLYVSF